MTPARLALAATAHPALLPRVLPFAAFVVLLALEPALARVLSPTLDPRWLYAVRAAVAAGLLGWFWRDYGELARPAAPDRRHLLAAVAIGLGVLALWRTLDGGWLVLGAPGAGFDPRAADGTLIWPLALARLAGAALVVPLIEELFWRAFVLRWLEDADFSSVAPGRVGGRALILSSIVFGLEHQQWAAGIVAGLAYGWLYRRSGNLWLAVSAHAVTNAGLGLHVLASGAWHYW